MYRWLVILIISVLAGCAMLTERTRTAEPLLPDVASLPCCWQVYEQLEIEFQGEQFTLSAVTAINNNELTVVFLDPLGRRVFTIMQRGSDVQVEKSIEIQQDFPVKWLLIGIYLRNMPANGWYFEHSTWEVEHCVDQVLLTQDDRIKVSLTESAVWLDTMDNITQQGITTLLHYPDIKLKVNITTLSRQSL